MAGYCFCILFCCDKPLPTLGRKWHFVQFLCKRSVVECLLFFSLQYGFNLEKWITTGKQSVHQAPSCPPYWMMFCSPQESHRAGRRSKDSGAPSPRPRSNSLNSADTRWLRHRTVKFLVSDSEDEDDYNEDTENSSTEDAPHPFKSRERPRSAAPKDPVSRVKDMHLCPSTHHCKPDSPRSLRGYRGSLPSLHDCRQPLRAMEQHRPLQASSLLSGQKNSKKKQRSLGSGSRKFSQNTPPAGPSPCRLPKQRPSSAGPVVKNHRHKVTFFILSVPLRGEFIKKKRPSLSFIKCLFMSVLVLPSDPEDRRPLRSFLWFSSRVVVSTQPGRKGATWNHHREGIPSTHSYSGSAEDRLPQSREGRNHFVHLL